MLLYSATNLARHSANKICLGFRVDSNKNITLDKNDMVAQKRYEISRRTRRRTAPSEESKERIGSFGISECDRLGGQDPRGVSRINTTFILVESNFREEKTLR